MNREALPFLAVGIFAATETVASRIAFSYVAPFPIAVTLAFFVGLTTAFVLNRRIVFATSADAPIVASAAKALPATTKSELANTSQCTHS